MYFKIKQMARQNLKGNWGAAIIMLVLIGIVNCSIVTSRLSDQGYTLSLVFLIITYPLVFGYITFFANVARNNDPKLKDIWAGFRKGNFLRSIVIDFLISLCIALATVLDIQCEYLFVINGIGIASVGYLILMLLLLIPEIILLLAVSMRHYVAIDNPEMSAFKCIRESRRLMKGHKRQLFCLEMSFIGWIFVSVFTFGILLIWIIPWIEEAKAVFYNGIKEG